MKIREPAVAGLFYPADPDELREMLSALLAAESSRAPARTGTASLRRRTVRKAVIAPHAGYVYSGPVAASAYRWLAGMDRRLASGGDDRIASGVILIGPSHRVAFRGLALPGADVFDTPLGRVSVDREACDALLELPFVHQRDDAHADEHSLEVHVPFLLTVFSGLLMVPIVIGAADDDEVAEALRLLWGGPETVIVASSDLSHFLPYAAAQRADQATARAIEELRSEAVGYKQACGSAGIQGLLALARERGLAVSTLDLRNSGDTAGPRDRVVGYGAFGIEEQVS
jgi:AmmeMemoRadiSam system protein B